MPICHISPENYTVKKGADAVCELENNSAKNSMYGLETVRN